MNEYNENKRENIIKEFSVSDKDSKMYYYIDITLQSKISKISLIFILFF